MKKVLVTGFEPFGGEAVNPSWEAVSRLPEELNGRRIYKLRLPVCYGEAAKSACDTASDIGADVIVSVGQAADRREITPEFIGINHRSAKAPDNAGVRFSGERIIDDAPDAYFSTVDVYAAAERIRAEGIPSRVSYSAGAYVCNDVLFTVLHEMGKKGVKAGFVHVPCTKEQREYGMELSDIVTALVAVIKEI